MTSTCTPSASSSQRAILAHYESIPVTMEMCVAFRELIVNCEMGSDYDSETEGENDSETEGEDDCRSEETEEESESDSNNAMWGARRATKEAKMLDIVYDCLAEAGGAIPQSSGTNKAQLHEEIRGMADTALEFWSDMGVANREGETFFLLKDVG